MGSFREIGLVFAARADAEVREEVVGGGGSEGRDADRLGRRTTGWVVLDILVGGRVSNGAPFRGAP